MRSFFPPHTTRRTFLQQLTFGTAALWAGGALGNSSAHAQPALDAVKLPGGRKLGVVLAGLGRYATGELAPALGQTRLCELRGVVTGDAEKGRSWSRKYGFPEKNVYHYDEMARFAEHRDVDIIYIVTPPGLHKEHVLRAARARKHIICEKPMANTVAECDEMIRACRDAQVKLSIGYRLQFEPHHQEIDRLARGQDFGPLQKQSGEHSMMLNERVWRVDKRLAGGGPLMDVGIYVIQAACRAAGGAMPLAVRAHEEPKTKPDLFAEVEETLAFTLEFPGGAVCEGHTSYQRRGSRFRAEGPRGWIELQPAFGYRGIKGATSQAPLNFPQINQQAAQMDDFAACIVTGRETPVPGEMGRKHLAIIEAIYEAARTGQRVEVQS